jgi:hypothetical protein
MQQASRQKLGIFIIIIGLLILIAIIYFGFFKNKTAAPQTQTVSTSTNQLPGGSGAATTTEIARNPDLKYDISKEAPHKVNGNDVAKIAMAFAERFGSYSNQSSYGNFSDLKILMTDNMKDWSDKYVASLKASSTNQLAYYGITTNALTSEVKKFDDQNSVAQIVVTTKRQEDTATVSSGAAYVQKLDLDFKKVNSEWLVDRAYWEKK